MQKTEPLETDKRPQVIFYSARDRMAAIVVTGLLQSNYRAMYANSPYLAIIKAAQFLPSLVIIDISENDTKGFAIAAALKKSSRTDHISLLLMLPFSSPDLLDNLKKTYWDKDVREKIGDIPVIQYPFSFAELLKKINIFL
jgi:PleD family two-component response regulator